jgi:hypothetical protein
MPYATPELLAIGSAKNLVLGDESIQQGICIYDNVLHSSHVDELW